VKGGKVKGVEFKGDFFTHQDLQPLYDAFVGVEFQREALRELFTQVRIEDYILGATADDILAVISSES
jgi:hypothetical protein